MDLSWGLVHPSAFEAPSDDFYTWRENIGHISWHGGAQVYTNNANALVPEDQQIPDISVWYPLDPNLGKNMSFDISGAGLKTPMNQTVTYIDKMITIPAFAHLYYKHQDLPFTYHEVLDDGEVDDAASYVLPADRTTSARFFVLADVKTDTAVHAEFDLSALNHTHAGTTVIEYSFPPDNRDDGTFDLGGRGANSADFTDAFAVGNVLEIDVHGALNALQGAEAVPVLSQHMHMGNNVMQTVIQDLFLSFEENRTFFITCNDVVTGGGARKAATTVFFHTNDCKFELKSHGGILHVCTHITKMYTKTAAGVWVQLDHTNDTLTAAIHASPGLHGSQVLLGQLGPRFQSLFFGDPGGMVPQSIFDDVIRDSAGVGPVFQSQRRISQHLCAPVLNPNYRIGCTAPLDYETMHLPPELRDFRLEMRDVNFSFLPGKVSLEPLVFYEFNGGNQAVAAAALAPVPGVYDD